MSIFKFCSDFQHNFCFGYYTWDYSYRGLVPRRAFVCKSSWDKQLSKNKYGWRRKKNNKVCFATGQDAFSYPKRCVEEKEQVVSLETTFRVDSASNSSQKLENQRKDTNCTQVIIDGNIIFEDFDTLELLNRRNFVLSLKALSLSEKLVVVFADLISDYLVFDMLCRISSPVQAVELVLGALVAYFLSDLLSGLFNWAFANYLSASFRWFRNTLRYYQWHVERPEEIVQMNFFDNVYSHCLIIIPFLLTTAYFKNNLSLFVESVLVFLFACIAIWPELHKWSHMEEPNEPPPAIVRVLQQLGVILNAVNHKEHHHHHDSQVEAKDGRFSRNKYYVASTGYSIVSGHWNWILDSIEFYRKLEYVIYLLTGVEPRIWSQNPNLRKRFVRTSHAEK